MQSDVKPYDPIGYSAWILIVGIALLVVVIGFIGLVVWLTRHKKPKTLATLPPKSIAPPDFSALRAKYLSLIDEVEASHKKGEISARELHQKLSVLLRFFAFETKGIHAPSLTLKDLKQTRLTTLTSAVEELYIPEFSAVSHGNVMTALQKAREVINTWS